MKAIQITAVVLGDSKCYRKSCCIKDNDCTQVASESHRTDVRSRCDNKQSCTVEVPYEKIPCGFFSSSNNDFERITYNCIEYTRNDTMNRPNSTYHDVMEDDNSTNSESEIAQGCAGSQLSLRCEETAIIEVLHVVIGHSNGTGKGCNISNSNCTEIASANHRMDVHRICDGQSNCTVDVIQENIVCGFNNRSSVSDFERITYNCMDDPQSHGTEMAQGCVSSQLSLRCNETKVIKVMHIFLGDSNGVGTICNISDINCTQIANVNHTMDVHHRCNGQSNCTIDVIQEKINCSWLDSWSNNDFEHIKYNCLNDSRNGLTSTDGTTAVTTLSYNTETVSATDEPNSQAQTLVAVIICLIILLTIIIAVVVMHRRKKHSQTKILLDPVAMTEVDENEYDICPDETQRTSLHDYNDAQPMYSLIDEADSTQMDEHQTIYSVVELRETAWNDGQTDRITTDKSKAATDTSVNNTTGTVSKAHTPQDDGGLTLIENDLYGVTDNSAQEITAEAPTYLLARDVSKTPSSQDDEGLTVIENDLYSH